MKIAFYGGENFLLRNDQQPVWREARCKEAVLGRRSQSDYDYDDEFDENDGDDFGDEDGNDGDDDGEDVQVRDGGAVCGEARLIAV